MTVLVTPDALVENPQREESPQAFWDAAKRVVLQAEPKLEALVHRMLANYSLSGEFYRTLNERIADSLSHY